MIEFILGIISGILRDSFLQRSPGEQRRAFDAYRKAWRSTRPPRDINALRDEFKEQSVPGAYVDPDGSKLAPWLLAWHEGLAPREARRFVRRSRRKRRHGDRP